MQLVLKNSEKVKIKILEAVFNCLYEQGAAGISLRSIAKAANVVQPTIHYYFGSKENLLIEFTKSLFERLRYNITRRFTPGDSPLRKLEAIFDAARVFIVKNKKGFVVLAECWGLCQRNKHLKKANCEFYYGFFVTIENILLEGQKMGVFKKFPENLLPVLITSFVHGLSHIRWTLPDNSFKVEEVFDFYINILRKSIIKKSRHKNNLSSHSIIKLKRV